jgi:hypothetical protein
MSANLLPSVFTIEIGGTPTLTFASHFPAAASDNSDARSNGRNYWVVFPDGVSSLRERGRKPILTKKKPARGHVRRFRLAHLRYEWGEWHNGRWYWDIPLFFWC